MAYLNCHLFSKYLAHETSVSIILPDGGENKPEDGYKVLYLLHGRGDDSTSWIRNSRIERYAKENNIVVIMPSAGTSFYVNGIYGKRYYSYISKELPEWAGRWLPIAKNAERTYIAGLSMGGYGALRIGLSNPDKFSKIGIFSAGVRPDLLPDFEETEEGNDILHENIHAAFGTGSLAEKDDPYAMIKNLVAEGKHIPEILHYEGCQDMLYEMNADFREFAQSQDISYRYEEWDGEHDWDFWDEALVHLFKEIGPS